MENSPLKDLSKSATWSLLYKKHGIEGVNQVLKMLIKAIKPLWHREDWDDEIDELTLLGFMDVVQALEQFRSKLPSRFDPEQHGYYMEKRKRNGPGVETDIAMWAQSCRRNKAVYEASKENSKRTD